LRKTGIIFVFLLLRLNMEDIWQAKNR
jgi:hypothetical protein